MLGLLRHALAADALSSTARRPSLGYSPREKVGIQSMQGSVRKNLECISRLETNFRHTRSPVISRLLI